MVKELPFRLGQVLLRNFTLGFGIVTAERSLLLYFGVLGNLLGAAADIKSGHSKFLSGLCTNLKNCDSKPLWWQLVFSQILGKVLTSSKIISERGNLAISCAMDSHTDVIQFLNRNGNVREACWIKQCFPWLDMVSQQASSFNFPKISVDGPRL